MEEEEKLVEEGTLADEGRMTVRVGFEEVAYNWGGGFVEAIGALEGAEE